MLNNKNKHNLSVLKLNCTYFTMKIDELKTQLDFFFAGSPFNRYSTVLMMGNMLYYLKIV